MKKTIIVSLVLALLLAILPACGGEQTAVESAAPAEETVQETAEETTGEEPAEEAAEQAAEESAEPAEEVEEVQEPEEDPNKVYITEEEAGLRQMAVDYMVEMASLQWTAGITLDYSEKGNANLVYETGKTYLGMVYNNNQTGLEMFMTVLDENNNYIGTRDSWNESPGNSCATSIRHAWQQVCASVEYNYSADMLPFYEDTGVVAVGDIDWSGYDGSNTLISVFNQNSREALYEAYAQMQPADALVRYLDTGGHAMMVTKAPGVIRDKDGNVDPDNSYLYITEQNNLLNELREFPSSWKVDYPMSFSEVSAGSYLPVSAKEFQEGKTEAPTFELDDAPTAENLAAGKVKGAVKSNFCLNCLELKLMQGDEVLQSAVSYPYSRSVGLKTVKGLDFDALDAGEYRFVVEATTGFGTEIVADISFTK